MQETSYASSATIVMVFIIALLLQILPMPEWSQGYRIPWTSLALIYWVLSAPHQVGVFSGWVLGLTQDALTGTMLGQHALTFSITAFICLQLYQRIRVFPVWQQSTLVLALLLLERIIHFWIISSSGHMPLTLLYWMPALLGGLLWPLIQLLLRDGRRLTHFG
ncbi:MAG: rod shape-determining protein MreD [Gammaproteobacteria bacterium]|nr:rod shape-determining protein MreD [Gammaproteobacteria bacterium]